LAAVPTIVTVVAELFGLAHPSNVLRAISALPLGAAAAWAVVSIARRDGIVPGPQAEI
jgi:hypothetical protein